MRELLFKGKRKDNGEWVEGFLLMECNHSTCSWNLSIEYKTERSGVFAYEVVEVIPETVSQYTGIDDKNDIKIFDGHIVKLYLEDTIETGVIRYKESKCRFVLEATDTSYGFDNTCIFEIIGNIYDNPELLGEVING